MCLTEPQCGTDLGLIRTRATPLGDGSYALDGAKCFISAGEHDLTENIVHLVLARGPDAPAGTRGLSVFLVPKFRVKPDGSLGARNGVVCSGIEHKMGIKASATCTLNFDEAQGFLVGKLHDGMRAMFTMMNGARLAVSIHGLGVAEAAYQGAVAYARERRQGRALDGPRSPDEPADLIIVHPDVRRMLLMMRSQIEGARALSTWVAARYVHSQQNPDEQARQEAEDFVSLLTPVLKAYCTDMGSEVANLGVQIYGGHGYIRDNGMEQLVRDARIAQIYEGANGIQALDLVGRKLAQDGGKHVMAFFDLVKGFIKENEDNEALKAGYLEPLKAASKDLQAAGMYFMQHGVKTPNAALAGSYDFMHLFGHVCLGLMWARMAKAADAALKSGNTDPDFYAAKMATGRFYMARMLPATKMHLARIESGAEPVMALEPAQF